jgi:hypothetical protein
MSMSIPVIISASTWMEYARLAEDVYYPSRAGKENASPLPAAWKRCEDALWKKGDDQGCRARLYQREDSATVLVYRGSAFRDYWSHVTALGNMQPFFDYSYEIYKQALNYIENHKVGALIAVIGHSMGGALAQLIAIQVNEETHKVTSKIKNPSLYGMAALQMAPAIKTDISSQVTQETKKIMEKKLSGKEAFLYGITFNPRHIGQMEVRYKNGITIPFPNLKRDYILSFEMLKDPVSSWLSSSPGAQRTNFRNEIGSRRKMIEEKENLLRLFHSNEDMDPLYRNMLKSSVNGGFHMELAQQKTALGKLEEQFEGGRLDQHGLEAIITHLQVTDKSSHLGLRVKS